MGTNDDAQTTRAPLAKITRSALMQAIALYDQIGEPAFLARTDVKRGRRYFLKIGERTYHSKALISVACEFVPEIGRALRSREFSGGAARLAPVFRRCDLALWDAKLEREVRA